MRTVNFSLTKLTRLQQAIQRNCCENDPTACIDVIAKVVKALQLWQKAEEYTHGQEMDIFAAMRYVLDAMESSEIDVNVTFTKKQIEEYLNNENNGKD